MVEARVDIQLEEVIGLDVTEVAKDGVGRRSRIRAKVGGDENELKLL